MTILPVVGLHVLVVVFESLRHRENLIKSMITGRKRKPTGTDIESPSMLIEVTVRLRYHLDFRIPSA